MALVPIFELPGVHGRKQAAQRAGDSAWFIRYQDRTPRGYRWGAWRFTSIKPFEGERQPYTTAGKARLPAVAQ